MNTEPVSIKDKIKDKLSSIKDKFKDKLSTKKAKVVAICGVVVSILTIFADEPIFADTTLLEIFIIFFNFL